MVGRGWSEVLDDGSTQGSFESQEDAVDKAMLDVGVSGRTIPAGGARAPAAPTSRAPPPPASEDDSPLTRAARRRFHLVPLRPRLALPAELRLAAAHLRRAVPQRREHHRLRRA